MIPISEPPVDYSEVVTRGMEYMDETVPNWIDSIDLNHLHMIQCSMCVCGQVLGNFYYFPGYYEYVDASREDTKETRAVRYGFALDAPDNPDQAYEELGIEWKRQILERRKCEQKKKTDRLKEQSSLEQSPTPPSSPGSTEG